MKNIISYTAVLALALTAPLTADIVNPAPAANTAGMRGNCDLLASNTVRASFIGLRDMTVQTIEQDAPTTVQVAVFEVIESLGYRKYVRYGDGQLTAGTRFTIAMNKELPGQPAAVVDTIAAMQPGEEALLKVDHLYLLGPREGSPIRACSRMVRRSNPVEATATATPAAPIPTPSGAAVPAPAGTPAADAGIPTTVTPLGGGSAAPQQAVNAGYTAQSTRMYMQQDANGNLQTVQVQHRIDANGQTHTRMFINGVEVDPQTRQPLTAAQPTPAAQPAPEQAAEDDSNDDTIIDRGPVPQQPVPGVPAVQQPQAPAIPAVQQPQGGGQGVISEEDSF